MVSTSNKKIRLENELNEAKNKLELLNSITTTKKLYKTLSKNFVIKLENGNIMEVKKGGLILITFVAKCKLNTVWENTLIEFRFNSLKEMSIKAILQEIETQKTNITNQIEYLENDLKNFDKDIVELTKLYEDFVAKINKHDFSIGIRASVLADFNSKLISKDLL